MVQCTNSPQRGRGTVKNTVNMTSTHILYCNITNKIFTTSQIVLKNEFTHKICMNVLLENKMSTQVVFIFKKVSTNTFSSTFLLKVIPSVAHFWVQMALALMFWHSDTSINIFVVTVRYMFTELSENDKQACNPALALANTVSSGNQQMV